MATERRSSFRMCRESCNPNLGEIRLPDGTYLYVDNRATARMLLHIHMMAGPERLLHEEAEALLEDMRAKGLPGRWVSDDGEAQRYFAQQALLYNELPECDRRVPMKFGVPSEDTT